MFKLRIATFSLLLFGSLGTSVLASDVIGRAVLIKGSVNQVMGNDMQPLAEGGPVFEGALIKTESGSTAKLMLQDQSTLALGPDSSMRMDEVRNQAAANVSILNGTVRSKVMKDLLSNGTPSNKVKFILKTKTAVMGVRGTEFEVIYNSSNQVTTLVTFEGAVAMIKVDTNAPSSFVQSANLVPLLTSAQAVLVTEGRFSTVNASLPSVTLPVKLSPAQFETLKKADPAAAAPGTGDSSKNNTHFGSPIPPGVDPKAFSSNTGELSKQLESKYGKNTIADAAKVSDAKKSHSMGIAKLAGLKNPPPEGSYDSKTKAYAPPAGGFVDLKTGLYIAPPPGSAFDSITGVYVPSTAVGKVDAETGSYIAPEGKKVDPNLGLVSTTPSLQKSGSETQSTKTFSPIIIPVVDIKGKGVEVSSTVAGNGGMPVLLPTAPAPLKGQEGNVTTSAGVPLLATNVAPVQFVPPPPLPVAPIWPINKDPSCPTCVNPPAVPVTTIVPTHSTSTNVKLSITVN